MLYNTVCSYMLCVVCVCVCTFTSEQVFCPSRFRQCIFSNAQTSHLYSAFPFAGQTSVIQHLQSLIVSIHLPKHSHSNSNPVKSNTPLWLLFMNTFSFDLKHTRATDDDNTWEGWTDRRCFINMYSSWWITKTCNTFVKAVPKFIAQ